jgi:hypothetical protein
LTKFFGEWGDVRVANRAGERIGRIGWGHTV